MFYLDKPAYRVNGENIWQDTHLLKFYLHIMYEKQNKHNTMHLKKIRALWSRNILFSLLVYTL